MKPLHTWQPSERHLQNSNVARLTQSLGVENYDQMLELSNRDPQRYWSSVLEYCQIVWEQPPHAYADLSAGAEFPKWFPGGQLNWVRSVLVWSERPGGASRIAVISEREDGSTSHVTYAQLAKRVGDFAGGLAARGIGRGTRVGLLMENGLEATISLLALSYVGAIVVPLFSGFGVDAVVSRLGSCRAQALIATTGFWRRGKRIDVGAVVRTACDRLPSVEQVIWKREAQEVALDTRNHDWVAVEAVGSPVAPAIMQANDPFMIIYTSGTTGKPKGAVHTHGGFPLKIAHDSVVHFDVDPGDVFCWPADMGWIAGTLVLASALLRGATLVCYDGAPDFPDWSRMSRLIERHGITHFGSAPTLIRGLASHAAEALQGDLSTVELLITAGEGIDPEHFSWFQQQFGRGTQPLINYTGGTEASGALLASVVVRPIAPSAFNTSSPGVDADVLDAAGTPLVNAVGELVVRSPFVGMTQSFWEDDQRYLETYWRAIPGIWVHGDLAMRSPDGSFYVMGRSDDIIKLAGKRVGPAEIEEVILELTEVAEAAAIGVEDAAKGQKLVVFLVRTSQGTDGADDDGLAQRVRSHVDERLGRPFRPSTVHVVSQLPKTRSSKIMRRVIRSVYCGLPAGDLSALDNPASLDELRSLTQPA